MENKVNRILQDKINLLSKQDLEDLGKSYVGKYGLVLYDKMFLVSKIIDYSTFLNSNGFDYNDEERDRKIGDKSLYFTLEKGETFELIDLAVVGDTLNVKDSSGGGYQNYEIEKLDEKVISFSGNLGVQAEIKFSFPITRKSVIYPMLMDIGWLQNRGVAQQPITQQASTTPTAFTTNASKILEYLQVSQEVSDGFPEDMKEFIAIIDGSQEIYAESKDSNKKEKLADLIVGWMRALMEFLKTQNLGIYALTNVRLEQQTLPQDQNPPTPPTPPTPPQVQPPTPHQQQPPDSGTPPPPSGGNPPPPSGGNPPPPSPPTPPTPPPPNEHKPPFTKEELEDAIASAEIMAEIGDEDGIRDLVELRDMYNRYYS